MREADGHHVSTRSDVERPLESEQIHEKGLDIEG
jgi:hypothetical protein